MQLSHGNQLAISRHSTVLQFHPPPQTMHLQTGVAIFTAFIMAGCVTLSGNYRLHAVDQQGEPVAGNMNCTAQGSSVYSIRNAFCARYPKATVFITSSKTGRNLDGESPYHCP